MSLEFETHLVQSQSMMPLPPRSGGLPPYVLVIRRESSIDSNNFTRNRHALFGLSLGLAGLVTPVHAQTITPVMSGLDAPRGLAFGSEGAVRHRSGPANPFRRLRRGRPWHELLRRNRQRHAVYEGVQERVATGLPSLYNTIRRDVVGANDHLDSGARWLLITLGWGGAPAARDELDTARSLVGTLIALQPSGHWRVDADISDFEDANNPAGGPKDSNPYGVVATPGDRYVTDAGGNSLLRVAANGRVSLVASFAALPLATPPPLPASQTAEAVPTEVVIGPDGAFYVSTLTGAPFENGLANVYRVVPGQAPTPYQSGFRTIIDIDSAPTVRSMCSSIRRPAPASPQRAGSPGSLRTTCVMSSTPARR